MNIGRELHRLLSYLIGKRAELEDLELKDIVMAKVILDIHRKRTRKARVKVPLQKILKIHRLDRDGALLATRERVAALEAHRRELVEAGEITCDALARLLPSVSWIKVVEDPRGRYLAFEGNGRVAAMQQVFGASDGMLVEVEQYFFRNPRPIVRRLNRVRRLNGLGDDVAHEGPQ